MHALVRITGLFFGKTIYKNLKKKNISFLVIIIINTLSNLKFQL